MPRRRQYYTQSQSLHTGGTSASAATILSAERYLQKETDYKNGIIKLNAMTSVLAEVIAISGPVESSLIETNTANGNNSQSTSTSTSSTRNSNQDDVEEFMNEQRRKVKALTERHVNSFRYIDACMAATNSIKADIQQSVAEEQRNRANGNSNRNVNGNNEDDLDVNTEENKLKDYETILQTKVEFQKHEIERNSIAIHNEEMVRSIRNCLNEKTEHIANGRNANADDDDDIEIEMTQPQNEQNASQYKCPLSGQFFKNPHKNKVCKHVYDYDHIKHHLQMKRTCPVMGCSNSNVTMSQLVVDEAMRMRVRRFLKGLERKRKNDVMSQDYDIDDDDDDEGLKEETVIE